MSSDNYTSFSNHETTTTWTKEENKCFEQLLTRFQDDCPMRYELIANCLQNKTAEQVRMHYEVLVLDVCDIEDDLIPMPNYRDDDDVVSLATNNNNNNNNNNDGNRSEAVVEKPQKKKRNRECKWTEDEHRSFLLGLHYFGKGDWRGISRKYVKTKSPTQVASHAQKHFLRQNEKGMKKRKSIHDITINSPQIQQLIANPNPNVLAFEVQQHPVDQQIDGMESESQHGENVQGVEVQHQTLTEAQHVDQEKEHSQDVNHGDFEKEQHNQKNRSIGLFEHEQWQMLRRQQQLVEHMIHHEDEVNQSQHVQEKQTMQENFNIDDLLALTEVNQGQHTQEVFDEQQSIDQMTLTEVNVATSVQNEHMIQQDTIMNDQTIVNNNMQAEEVIQGQVQEEEEQRTRQNSNVVDLDRVNQGSNESLLLYNCQDMPSWNDYYLL